jgi:hypothetical protein
MSKTILLLRRNRSRKVDTLERSEQTRLVASNLPKLAVYSGKKILPHAWVRYAQNDRRERLPFVSHPLPIIYLSIIQHRNS